MSELRIERTFAIAPGELFAFLTQPERLLQWWGPEGMSAGKYRLDLAAPGPWSFELLQPGGGRFVMSGVVREVVPPRLIELTMNVPGASDAPDSVVRFEIESDGADGSRLTLIQSGITDQMVAMGQRGWGSTLARLEKLVGARSRATG